MRVFDRLASVLREPEGHTGGAVALRPKTSPPATSDTLTRTRSVRVSVTPAEAADIKARRALLAARAALYAISGGSYDSNDVTAASLSLEKRVAYFESPAFKNWVAAEKACGRQVFWLKDVDKTQASGDVFTFFFKWRADNGRFSAQHNEVMKKFLADAKAKDPSSITDAQLAQSRTNSPAQNAYLVLDLWKSKEAGAPGIGLLDFWSGVYWPTQLGLTRAQKRDMVRAFAPDYAPRVFPSLREDNKALEAAGVHVVIVSNGDQELARAVAPILGIKPKNAVGSHLMYDKNGISTGVNHAYEIFDHVWGGRPQPGKPLSFHYWMNANKDRWHWNGLDEERIVLAGRDGDSASSDGGMMILMNKPAAIGNFMVDTPNEPGRLTRFLALAKKYGWTKGQFFTLVPKAPAKGPIP
jgi:hypothetical protein